MWILAMMFAVATIPGITAKDVYPHGCVDCHTGKANMPAPLSADLKGWTTKVDPALVTKVQPSAPKGVTLKGKHPNVTAMVKDIPGGCLKCHAQTSKSAPPLASMMHEIHLTGGEKNPFLTTFGGHCTHCHKLDAKTGAWSLGSGAEK